MCLIKLLQNTELPTEIRQWMIRQLQKLGFQNRQKKLTAYGTDSIWSFSFSRLVNKQQQSPLQTPTTYSQQKTIQTTFQIHKIFYISIFYLMNNYSSFIMQQQKLIRFNREQYLKIFRSQEQKRFSSEMIKTMMFIRLCEFHKHAEKSLKWNQSDICSLFVYCHYIMKQDNSEGVYWDIGEFELLSVSNDTNINITNLVRPYTKNNSQKFNQYIDYVIKRNINQLTSALTEWKTYKVQHYLVKYLNFINYLSPGKITIQEKQYDNQSSNWLGWLWQLLQTQEVEKQEKFKKEKLNKLNDFFNQNKTILNLNQLFQNIGNDLFGSLKKNLGLNGWTNAKIIEKMKFNRDMAKSSLSAK